MHAYSQSAAYYVCMKQPSQLSWQLFKNANKNKHNHCVRLLVESDGP